MSKATIAKSLACAMALATTLPLAAETEYLNPYHLEIAVETEYANGYTWTYGICDDCAVIFGLVKTEVFHNSSGINYRSLGDYVPAISPNPSGTVVIPASLGGRPVTSIGEYAFYECNDLTSVTIPEGVTSIGFDAFFGCSGLTNLTIPDSVTSIEWQAFYGCSGVTNVAIPASVVYIGEGAFSSCGNLMSFSVAAENPSYCSIAGLLLTKDAETLIQGVNGDVTIPDGVIHIEEGAFSGCNGLTHVAIPGSVTSIGNSTFGLASAFDYCGNLISITVSEDNSVYRSVNNLLLTKDGQILVSGVNGDVVIPDGVTNVMYGAFEGLSGLTSVTIPNSLTNIAGYTFFDCGGLKSLVIGANHPTYQSVNGMLLTKDGESLVIGVNGDVVVPDGVKSIGCAFNRHGWLTSVVIPDSVTNIPPGAFYGCDSLTNMVLPFVCSQRGGGDQGSTLRDLFSLIDIYYYPGGSYYAVTNFLFPASLKSMTITDETILAPYAFAGFSQLTSIEFPDDISSIGDYAFYGCSGLLHMSIPGSVGRVGQGAFSWCTNLREVVVSEGVKTIAEEAFLGCFNLEKLALPNSITGIAVTCNYNSGYIQRESSDGLVCQTKGLSPFSGCTNLLNVTIPVYLCEADSQFYEYVPDERKLATVFPDSWQSITNVVVNDGVTSLPNGLFWKCTRLQSVTIPASVTRLGSSTGRSPTGFSSNGVFEDCSSLKNVVFEGDAPDMGDDVFLGTPRSLVTYVNPESIGWNGGVSTGLPDTWNGRSIAFIQEYGGSSGGSGTPGGNSQIVADTRYSLTGSVEDRAIASLTIDGDTVLDEFVLRDGKVYDSVLYVVNRGASPARLIMPSGHTYVTVGGLTPLSMPAVSTNLVTITRVAVDTFLVTRQNLEAVK